MLAMFSDRDLEIILEIYLWLETIVLVFTATSDWSSHVCASVWNLSTREAEAGQAELSKICQWSLISIMTNSLE